jgi:hypothetical protein
MSFGYVLGIKFLGPLSSGDTISMSWTGAGGTIVTSVETFVPTRTTNFKTTIGTTAVNQATNFFNAITLDYSGNFNITGNSGTDTVYISSKNTTNPMSGLTTSSNVAFNFVPTLTIDEDIRVRSPYLLISTGDTFSSSVFEIKQFEGDKDTFLTQPLSYIKTKNKVVNSQNNIWISLSNMVKEKLEGNINNFVVNNYTTALDLAANESKWVSVKTINRYLDTDVSENTTGYFVVDGYVEPLEQQGLPNLLLTGNKRYVTRSTTDRLYFKTVGLTAATYITSSDSTPVSITYAAASATTFNTKYVQSIKVNKLNLAEQWVQYNFNYAGLPTQSVRYELYDECKFENYNLVFKNKYGMLESFPMAKKSIKSMSVTSNDYIRSIVDYNGDFDINRHTSRQFNVSGKEELVLNTDYIPEYMNAPIKEAMLTEEMWLIDSLGNILPVVKLDQRIDFKTSLNDKLIQYTITVRLSHEQVKNIQ